MLSSAGTGKAEFSSAYLTRLRLRDPQTEAHFAAYFSGYLESKLRNQIRHRDLVQDVRQETLVRVLEAVYKRDELRHPERFGAFVNSVCNHVLHENWRRTKVKGETLESAVLVDGRRNPEAAAQLGEEMAKLRNALVRLQKRDRDLLRMIYWEETDRHDISKITHMSPDHVRVTLHRAKRALRKYLDEARAAYVADRKGKRKVGFRM